MVGIVMGTMLPEAVVAMAVEVARDTTALSDAIMIYVNLAKTLDRYNLSLLQ